MELFFGKKKKNETVQAQPAQPVQKKQPVQTPTKSEIAAVQEAPRYIEAWGAYAASARFRGWMAFICALCALFAVTSTMLMAGNFKPVVVAVNTEGKPEVLNITELKVSREVFVKEFLDSLYSYMPMNVDEKAQKALDMMTAELRKAWSTRMGTEWTRLVKANDVLQVMSIRKVEVTDQEKNSFTAVAQVVNVRTEQRTNLTETKEGTVTLTVKVGAISFRNPFGLYVDILKDETRDVIRR
jgi:hypothetical protein